MLGGGGYVAAPAGLAARSLRLPLVLTEADSHLGVANRLLAPFAERVFLAFDLPGRTGREVGGHRPARPGRRRRRRPGGGARPLRDRRRSRVPARVRRLAGRAAAERGRDRRVRQRRAVLGPARLRAARLRRSRAPAGRARAARLTTSCSLTSRRSPTPTRPPTWPPRAPGGSVFELLAAGLPAVLVPYPHATADHQTKNARWVERGGAAVVVPDERARRPAARPRGGGPARVVRAAPHNAARGARARAPGRCGADRSRDSHVGLQVMGVRRVPDVEGHGRYLSRNWVPVYWGRCPHAESIGSPSQFPPCI